LRQGAIAKIPDKTQPQEALPHKRSAPTSSVSSTTSISCAESPRATTSSPPCEFRSDHWVHGPV